MNGRELPLPKDFGDRLRALSPSRLRLLAHRLDLPESARADQPQRPTHVEAWVQASGLERMETGQWREFLSERLPDYMIPARVEPLESIPRLPNGKVDRNALRRLSARSAPERSRPSRDEMVGLLGVMQAIWRDVLQADEVYPDDDFFELGGDSLMSINVVARAREQGVVMKPTDLFDFPRLSELCERITEEADERGTAADSGGPTLRSRNVEGSGRPFFMVHGGGRLLAQMQDSLGPEQPIHLLSAHWEQGDLAIDISMQELADEAIERLLELQPEGPYSIGGYSFGAVIAYEIALRLIARGDAIDLLFMLDPPEDPKVFHSVPEACRALPREGDFPAGGTDHWERLRSLGPIGGIGYAAGKLKGHAGHYVSRLVLDARHAYALTCRRFGLLVQPSLRKLYVFRRYLAAANRYSLQPIDCSILLYRARRGYHKYGAGMWRELARGGLTVEEFDCEHEDLQWNPELVAQWTARFGAQLEAARSGAAADAALPDA